ncbi:MAG TPA: translation elongation factor 4 [Chloroflexota bacterium]|nr:translation elongation factor 4 [Chloroflexota bacterium]
MGPTRYTPEVTPTSPTLQIRNFCIIAHVDHGKSTLADRLLEFTGTVTGRELQEQTLDQLELEREKGITIKAKAVRLFYTADDGLTYQLNLIDTPGHVDFGYEVSRALAACEGALLVVDAGQGIEAQTLANTYQALEHNLAIIPVVNKIDLPSAQPQHVAREIERVIGLPEADCILASAKTGVGTKEILEAIVRRVPPPRGESHAPPRALIFDSHYDPHKGVIAYVRLVDGHLRAAQKVRMMQTGSTAELLEMGVFRPRMTTIDHLDMGEVGYLATGLKSVADCRVGDTVTDAGAPAAEPLPGYRPAKPMVFAGFYPVDSVDYPLLRDALDKLKLNDAALVYEPETSTALGFGFRCGFLGLLHMEIVQERLERDYGLNLLATVPSVEYEVLTTSGDVIPVDNPAAMPSPDRIEAIYEPWMQISVVTPSAYIGAIMDLVTSRRGEYQKMEYLDEGRVLLQYAIPLSEILVDFYDQLKSRTQGYASLDYAFEDNRPGDLVKLDVLVNNQPVDALSLITHREKAYQQGRDLVQKLRSLIPRQLFEVPIQAAIGSRIIARETVRAMRKDVLAKCYGGDVTRKRKLLEKQKEGKSRMKRVGNVEIPQEAFLAVLKL